MRRSRAARPHPSMSLFPFLAVLICTMGVLIILLVLVTREANLNAEAKAQDSAADRDARQQELQDVKGRESLRSSMLADLQPELQQRLNDARLRRSHLEDQIRELELQAEKLKAQFAAIAKEPQHADISLAERQLASLQQQIEQAELELQSARDHVQHLQRSYAVVPYPGPNGTTRRPIYLECSAEGIRMQPHNILFTSRELHQPVLAGNPLDAALLAVREYWAKYGKENEEPYPLLIVRPDGANAYAMAREAMKSWDSEFGYELVDRDIPLQFPGDDPELEKYLTQVIEVAWEKQEKLQSALAFRQRMQALSNGDRGGPGGFDGGTDPGGYQSGMGSGEDSDTGAGDPADAGLTLRATRRHGGFVVERESEGGGHSGRNHDRFSENSGSPSGKPGWEIDPFGNVRLRGSGDGGPGATAPSDRQVAQGDSSRAGSSPHDGTGNQDLSFNPSSSGSLQQSPTGSESANPRQLTANPASSGSVSQQGLAGSATSSEGAQAALGMSSLAESRGSNWALPSKSPQATAYRKPIQLGCTGQRLTIYPGAYSAEPVRQVELTGKTSEHMDELVDGVWRLIDSWGSAGYNAYWKPEIHVLVGPDGEQRFRELQALMEGSGIEIKRKSP